MENINFRYLPKEDDIENVRKITESTDFFYDHEVLVAVELIEDRIRKGVNSEYSFIFAEIQGKTIAYSCYGKIACTKNSYDLYWIVTHNDYRGKGIGKILLSETEAKIKEEGGKRIYAETSSTPKYLPTRRFYESSNYFAESVLKEFYNDNDDKITFVKIL
jgi:N-acetylglutamate synthase-like GNAT family acetyltransferase